ncbi:putative histidine kinase 4 [Hordeum vulgare]|nr:putative histidine kinase 4 [Hordeum vulgare]
MGARGWRAKSKLSAAVAMVGVALAAGVERGAVLVLHRSRRHNALVKAEEGIVCMCEERARMLQDQFAVSVNLVATFHYEKQRPALDQRLLELSGA